MTKKSLPFAVGCIETLTDASMSFLDAAEGLLTLGIPVRLLAEGTQAAQERCMQLLHQFPKTFEILESYAFTKDHVLGHSTVVFFATRPTAEALKELKANRTICIAPPDCGITNYSPQAESGNGFVYPQPTMWHITDAILRARETAQFTYDWREIQKRFTKKQQTPTAMAKSTPA